MHKTMLIILAAVVALIVIVVLTGMRYLRADDEDDFDDESGAQRGQSRGRREHPARDHLRPRHHDDDRRGDQPRQRPREAAVRGAGRGGADRDRSERAVFAGVGAARRGSGRNDSSGATFARDAGGAGMSRSGAGRDSGARSGDRRGPNRDGAVRDGGIRDSGQRDAPGRDIATRRGERGRDDTGRDDRRNSGPQRRVTGAREHDRDAADDLVTASTTSSRGSAGRGGVRAEDFDDRTARPSGRDAGREYPRGQEGGRSNGSREALSPDSAGTGRDDRVRDDRERRGNSGQNARPDSRRTPTTQGRNDDSLPDVKPRPVKTSQGKTSPSKTSPGKSKRDGDGDWPSTEWDELSDVDYWAELASDKPFTGAGPTKPAGRSDRDRADKRSETDSGQIRAVDRRDSPDRRESLERRDRDIKERRDAGDRRDAAERRDQMLPAARATVDAAFMPPVTGDAVDHAFTARTDAYGSTELRRAIASGRTSTTGPHRTPEPADDDPLTSPSFPRISADDSRSYRRANGRGPGESESQTRPHAAYPPLPPHPAVGPLDSQPGLSRTSGGYSQPAASGAEYAAAPLPDQYRQPTSAQESRPAHPLTSSYSTPAPALPATYLPPVGNGYPADSASSTYSAPTSATSGYPAIPAVGYQGADPTSYQAPMSVPNLPGPNLPGPNLPGPNLPGPNPASFAAEHDNGYGAVAPAGTGYQGAPAEASYPPLPVELPGYSSYPGVGQIPAAQPQSTGFSYSQPADPGFGGQLPAAEQSGSYLGDQPPAHTGQAGVYQMPAPSVLPPPAVQPGYPSAPYSAAPYEPPAYPAPTRAYEADGGYPADPYPADPYPADPYPADPYAVDPYGYPGYGSARLSDQRWHGLPLSDQRWDERSRQEQSTDDRSGTARYEYQQYWEDDDR